MAEEKKEDESIDQNEIDAMLGNKIDTPKKESGIEKIIRAGFVAYERMPMLENVFDRLIRLLSKTLRGFTSDNVDIIIEEIRSLRFGDFMNSVPSSSVFGIFKAEEWRSYGLIILDADLSYSLIDMVMGGEKNNKLSISENRPHTALERGLIEKILSIVLSDLSEAFLPIEPVSFTLDRLEISSSLASIVAPSNASTTARFHIDMDGRSGNLDIVIPYATLEPVREKLTQQFMGDSFGGDSVWEDHLVSEILETSVQVSTAFESVNFPLSKLRNLRKGDVLHIPCDPENPHAVKIECDNTVIFRGTLGKLKNKQAVKIEKRFLPPEEKLTPEFLSNLVEKAAKEDDVP